MPIHDLGYRAWNGRLTSVFTRWWVIAQTNILLAWRSRWLRRLMIVAWLPAAYMAVGFFFIEPWFANHTDHFQMRFNGVSNLCDQRWHKLAALLEIAAFGVEYAVHLFDQEGDITALAKYC